MKINSSLYPGPAPHQHWGRGKGRWKETEGGQDRRAVLRSGEGGHFPGAASWSEEEGACL